MALRLKPNSVIAYNSRGIAYRHLGQFDKAIADYSKAIRLKPDYAAAYSSRAFAYMAKGDIEKAIADYQTLIGMGRELVWSNYRIGFAYEQLGHVRSAQSRSIAGRWPRQEGTDAAEREAKELPASTSKRLLQRIRHRLSLGTRKVMMAARPTVRHRGPATPAPNIA